MEGKGGSISLRNPALARNRNLTLVLVSDAVVLVEIVLVSDAVDFSVFRKRIEGKEEDDESEGAAKEIISERALSTYGELGLGRFFGLFALYEKGTKGSWLECGNG